MFLPPGRPNSKFVSECLPTIRVMMMTDKIVVVKPVPVECLELLKAKMKLHVRRILGNKSCAKRWQRPFA